MQTAEQNLLPTPPILKRRTTKPTPEQRIEADSDQQLTEEKLEVTPVTVKYKKRKYYYMKGPPLDANGELIENAEEDICVLIVLGDDGTPLPHPEANGMKGRKLTTIQYLMQQEDGAEVSMRGTNMLTGKFPFLDSQCLPQNATSIKLHSKCLDYYKAHIANCQGHNNKSHSKATSNPSSKKSKQKDPNVTRSTPRRTASRKRKKTKYNDVPSRKRKGYVYVPVDKSESEETSDSFKDSAKRRKINPGSSSTPGSPPIPSLTPALTPEPSISSGSRDDDSAENKSESKLRRKLKELISNLKKAKANNVTAEEILKLYGNILKNFLNCAAYKNLNETVLKELVGGNLSSSRAKHYLKQLKSLKINRRSQQAKLASEYDSLYFIFHLYVYNLISLVDIQELFDKDNSEYFEYLRNILRNGHQEEKNQEESKFHYSNNKPYEQTDLKIYISAGNSAYRGSKSYERPERLKDLSLKLSKKYPVTEVTESISEQDIARVHTQTYINENKRWEELANYFGVPLAIDTRLGNSKSRSEGETFVNTATIQAAYQGANATKEAVKQAVQAQTPFTFVVARPPGHHAEPENGSGFCLYNNAAIAVEAEAADLNVLHIDFDIHAGDGTRAYIEKKNENSPQKKRAMIDIFSSNIFPYQESNSMDKENLIFSQPVKKDAKIDDVAQALQEGFNQIDAVQFQPQLIIIHAGFDGHKDEKVAQDAPWLLESKDYGILLEQIQKKFPNTPKVVVLEGGYNAKAIHDSSISMLNSARFGSEALSAHQQLFPEKSLRSTEYANFWKKRKREHDQHISHIPDTILNGTAIESKSSELSELRTFCERTFKRPRNNPPSPQQTEDPSQMESSTRLGS